MQLSQQARTTLLAVGLAVVFLVVARLLVPDAPKADAAPVNAPVQSNAPVEPAPDDSLPTQTDGGVRPGGGKLWRQSRSPSPSPSPSRKPKPKPRATSVAIDDQPPATGPIDKSNDQTDAGTKPDDNTSAPGGNPNGGDGDNDSGGGDSTAGNGNSSDGNSGGDGSGESGTDHGESGGGGEPQ